MLNINEFIYAAVDTSIRACLVQMRHLVEANNTNGKLYGLGMGLKDGSDVEI